MINCVIELDLTWTKNCVIYEISKTAAVAAIPNAHPPILVAATTTTTSATFQINKAKLYMPIVILPKNGNIKFLENIK